MTTTSHATRRRRAAVAGALAVALTLAGGSAPAHAATTPTTASCVDGGGITWRTKVFWGDPYAASDGVQRVSVGFAGWTTNAGVMATNSTVETYSGSGVRHQKLTRTASPDYRSGAFFDARNPRNPPTGGAKVRISVGKANDGKASCSATHVQPSIASTEKRITAYVTGYTYYDNTPPGTAAISHPIIHTQAGGVGTYDDPITMAVGHSFATGRDVLDYVAGTRFYLPYLKRYFIVEDTCGDGDSPQDGPCHAHPPDVDAWLDIWVDGRGGTANTATACAERITGNYPVIWNPTRDHATEPGPVGSPGGCALDG